MCVVVLVFGRIINSVFEPCSIYFIWIFRLVSRWQWCDLILNTFPLNSSIPKVTLIQYATSFTYFKLSAKLKNLFHISHVIQIIYYILSWKMTISSLWAIIFLKRNCTHELKVDLIHRLCSRRGIKPFRRNKNTCFYVTLSCVNIKTIKLYFYGFCSKLNSNQLGWNYASVAGIGGL